MAGRSTSRGEEVYISVDIEASGPIPGEYSLLSLGACVVCKMSETFSFSVSIVGAMVTRLLNSLNREPGPFATSIPSTSLLHADLHAFFCAGDTPASCGGRGAPADRGFRTITVSE